MISQNAIIAGQGAAAALAAANLSLQATQGTPLGELVRLSNPVVSFDATGRLVKSTAEQTNAPELSGDAEYYGFMVEAATAGTLDSPTQHSLELDGLVNDLSKLVAGHVAHAKNIVRPLVQELAEAFNTYQTTYKPEQASDAANIKALFVPAPLEDMSFLDTLTPYNHGSTMTPDKCFGLPAATKEQLDALFTVGHDRTDKMIVEWLSQQPENFQFDVWTKYFTIQNRAGFDEAVAALGRRSPFERLNELLAILLISRKLENEVVSVEMSLAQYNTICSQYIAYASASLLLNLMIIGNDTRSGILIVSKNPNAVEVGVNGVLYKNWLDQGGKPEAILGALITEGSGNFVTHLTEKNDEYLRAWNSYSALFSARSANSATDRAESFLISTFSRMLTEASEEEKAILKDEVLASTMKDAETYIRQAVRSPAIKDPYEVALVLIAKIRFSYTSAYQILSDIVQVAKANPNVDVREAALVAVINYISDYLSGQITAINAR